MARRRPISRDSGSGVPLSEGKTRGIIKGQIKPNERPSTRPTSPPAPGRPRTPGQSDSS